MSSPLARPRRETILETPVGSFFSLQNEKEGEKSADYFSKQTNTLFGIK